MPWYSIRVSDWTKKKLEELQKKLGYNCPNDVIVFLVRFYEQHSSGDR